MAVEAVLQAARWEFQELTERTLQRLRAAVEKELADAKAEVKAELSRQEPTAQDEACEAAAQAPTPRCKAGREAWHNALPLMEVLPEGTDEAHPCDAHPGHGSERPKRGTTQLRAIFERKASKSEMHGFLGGSEWMF
ncbi:unnamed protein product [Effrenium voratum]|nr:unnamed protein product [Effrenium voratum]